MTDEPETPWKGGVGFEPIATMLRDAVEAQAQAVSLAQSWSINIMAAYREQAEEYNAMLNALNRSLQAMEELVESQTKATKALGETLDASRELLGTALTSHQRTLERVESLVTDMVQQAGGHVQALRDQTLMNESIVSGPLAAQNEVYLKLMREWADAYSNFLGGVGAKRPESDPGEAR